MERLRARSPTLGVPRAAFLSCAVFVPHWLPPSDSVAPRGRRRLLVDLGGCSLTALRSLSSVAARRRAPSIDSVVTSPACRALGSLASWPVRVGAPARLRLSDATLPPIRHLLYAKLRSWSCGAPGSDRVPWRNGSGRVLRRLAFRPLLARNAVCRFDVAVGHPFADPGAIAVACVLAFSSRRPRPSRPSLSPRARPDRVAGEALDLSVSSLATVHRRGRFSRLASSAVSVVGDLTPRRSRTVPRLLSCRTSPTPIRSRSSAPAHASRFRG